jgi:hypothetical protein
MLTPAKMTRAVWSSTKTNGIHKRFTVLIALFFILIFLCFPQGETFISYVAYSWGSPTACQVQQAGGDPGHVYYIDRNAAIRDGEDDKPAQNQRTTPPFQSPSNNLTDEHGQKTEGEQKFRQRRSQRMVQAFSNDKDGDKAAKGRANDSGRPTRGGNESVFYEKVHDLLPSSTQGVNGAILPETVRADQLFRIPPTT